LGGGPISEDTPLTPLKRGIASLDPKARASGYECSPLERG